MVHCQDCRLPEKHSCPKTNLGDGRWFRGFDDVAVEYNDTNTATKHDTHNTTQYYENPKPKKRALKIVSVVLLVGMLSYFVISPDVFFATAEKFGLSDVMGKIAMFISQVGSESTGTINEIVETNPEPIQIDPTDTIDTATEFLGSISTVPPLNHPDVITWDVVSKSVGRAEANSMYVYYPSSYLIAPVIPENKDRVVAAIQRGFEIWEMQNEQLDFERGDGSKSDILVYWDMNPSPSHIGLAFYSSLYSGVIAVHMGDFDCNGEYIEWDSDSLTNT